MTEDTGKSIETVIQDWGINVNTLSQVAADMAADAGFRELLKRTIGETVGGDMSFYTTSAIAHTLSEIIIPAFVNRVIVPYVLPLPGIGKVMFKIIDTVRKTYGLGVAMKMVTVVVLQMMVGKRPKGDIMEAAIMTASELLVNRTVEVPEVAKALSFRF